ncbi:MAG: DUF4962 domain-containing protein [Planctomycetes bacterium]|nr:DUF4962 domain-containing protein [Planctomycetota bacterium]MBL7042107.1 DUF4962 domain-containing protein [Pirellulaceae bacterium]
MRVSGAFALGLLLLGLVARAGEPAVVLDREPSATQKPYAPADGQVVKITPPPFIWVPLGRDSRYVLQVSTSDAFPEEKTQTYRKLQRSVFVPQEPLAAGDWFWRYGVETGDGTVFGRARPFTVPRDARAFPFPDWDEAIGRVPRQRPRLFFSGERLKQVRQWAGGELKPAIDSLVASCEREVGKRLVAEPGYRPKGPDYGPWAINVMRTTRPPMDVMERCALAYLITGNQRLGQEAKRRLQHFFSWDPDGPTSFFAYDEPPMWMMMRGTRAYDWTYDLFTPEERVKIEPNMRARAAQFLKQLQRLPFESNPYNSHAGRLPGFLGECALSFIHEWPEAREWLEYATLLYYTSYPAWGGDDGGWQEGPGYWSAYMRFALHYVVALREAAGVDLMEKPFFRSTPYYGLYTATPYHQHSPFGDGQTGSPRGLGNLMYVFSTLTQNPCFRWYADESRVKIGADVLSLATYDPNLQSRSPLELPQARSFPAVGLASFHTALGDRENDISFLMRSSPFGGVSHGHADQNAYVIEAFGQGLAIATGYYPWYGSPHHHQWTRATKAVNSILVDGQGQVPRRWDANGELVAFESVDGYDYAEAEAAPAYLGRLERFRRHVVHVRPGVFVLFDDLRAPEPARFQWLLHAYKQINVDETSRTLRVENAPAAMDVHLLLPDKVDFTQTDKYEPEPESTKGRWSNTWHLTASTAAPAQSAHFLAVLLPHRQGKEDTLPKVELLSGQGAVGVRLTSPDGARDVVGFRISGEATTVTCGGIESDGRVFARGKDKDGTICRQFTCPGE